ncbi:reverse transcriptase-like protein [Micromonospora sp. M12]
MGRFSAVRFTWIPREQNRHADALANAAMDAAAGRPRRPRPPAVPRRPLSPRRRPPSAATRLPRRPPGSHGRASPPPG